jgi:uncharacterized repeat protein (TIGR02543 family)
MKTAVIFELDKKKAVALTPDGDFVYVPNKGYTLGQRIVLGKGAAAAPRVKKAADAPHTKRLAFRWALSLSAVLVIALSAVFGARFYTDNYTTAYALTLEINPKVELLINPKGNVWRAIALNGDAETLPIKDGEGESVGSYLNRYLSSCEKAGFLSPGKDAHVSVTLEYRAKKADKGLVNVEKLGEIIGQSLDGLSVDALIDSAEKTADGTVVPKSEQAWVYFHANDGGADYTRTAQTVGKTVIFPAVPPTHSGAENIYQFVGWSSRADEPPAGFVQVEPVLTGEASYYAVWQNTGGAAAATVTFLLNDGTAAVYETMTGQILESPAVYPAVNPTRGGYVFLGWSREQDILPENFDGGGDDIVHGDTEYYAVWQTLPTATVIFLLNDGTSDVYETIPGQVLNAPTAYPPIDPTRTGFTFLGWSKSREQDPGTFLNNESHPVTGDMELYAVWQISG